jgi:hypothetical protein
MTGPVVVAAGKPAARTGQVYQRQGHGPRQIMAVPAERDMSASADALPGLAPEERFEITRRGYDRRQVEEFADRSRREAANMRSRLDHALREAEQLRIDLAAARRAAWEATAQSERAAREVAALRTQAQMALARNLWWPPPQQDDE